MTNSKASTVRPLGPVHPAPGRTDLTDLVPYGGPMHRSRVGPLLALVLVLQPLAACGSDGTTTENARGAEQRVSEADQACRDRWHDLSATVATQAARGGMVKRFFASRWESLAAGVAYHESTATADQCDEEIDAQKEAIRSQRVLVDKVLPFDMEDQLAKVREGRGEFAAAHPQAKEPAQVRQAYRTLGTLYDAADQALAPAVVQLANTDPTESTTITRRMRDLALLAQTSDVWQVCKSALRTIHAYEHLQQDGKKSG
jgi:hypothetical protein